MPIHNSNGSNGNGSNGQGEFAFNLKPQPQPQPVRKPVKPVIEDEDDDEDDEEPYVYTGNFQGLADLYREGLDYLWKTAGPGSWGPGGPTPEQEKRWEEIQANLDRKNYGPTPEELEDPFRVIFSSVKARFTPGGIPAWLISWDALLTGRKEVTPFELFLFKFTLVLGIPALISGLFMLAWTAIFREVNIGPCLAILLLFFLIYRFARVFFKRSS